MKTKHLFSLIFFILAIKNSHAQAPGWLWARTATGHQNDQAYTVATDVSGNVFVAGFFASDSIIFGTVTLHNKGVGNQDMFLAKYDAAGVLQWAKNEGGSADDKAFAVAADASGNVFVAGYFYSPTIIIGSDTLTNAGTVGDIFIVKYDSNGNVLWTKREGGPSVEIPYTLVLDPFGNLYVAGRFSSNTITFGTTTLTQAGSMDVFLVKYNAAGNVVWAKGAGGGSNDEAYSLCLDAAGNVMLAGYFNQTIAFGTTSLISAGSADMFLAKYDTAGTLLWARRAGGSGDDRAKAVTADASGNTYATGYFVSTSITFGTVTLNNSGGDNSFVVKYDAAGNVVWAKSVNGDSRANGAALFNNELYVCGGFSGDTLTFGPNSLFINGTSDFYVLNCDTAGHEQWATKQTSGGGSGESGNSIAADVNGHVYVAGYFGSDTIAFGPSVLNNTVSSFDLFVARLGTTATGIPVVGSENDLMIYPNPATNQLTVSGLSPTQKNVVEIYDNLGRLMINKTLPFESSQTETVDVSSLHPGFYFVKVISGERPFTTKLLIR